MRTLNALVLWLESADELSSLSEAAPALARRRSATTVRRIGSPATSFNDLKPSWLPGYWSELKQAHKERRPAAHDVSFERSLHAAKHAVESNHGMMLGERLGAGRSGAAFAHGTEPNTVVKFDRGDREARLARYTMASKDLRKGSVLPRYHKVINTGVRDQKTGENIHALHREDLGDLQTKTHDAWHAYGLGISGIAERLANSGKSHHDYDSLRREFDGQHREVREHIPDNERQRFDRFHRGLHKLLRHGIIPCDMHADNLGQRDNGEVVLRDAGCHHRVQFS